MFQSINASFCFSIGSSFLIYALSDIPSLFYFYFHHLFSLVKPLTMWHYVILTRSSIPQMANFKEDNKNTIKWNKNKNLNTNKYSKIRDNDVTLRFHFVFQRVNKNKDVRIIKRKKDIKKKLWSMIGKVLKNWLTSLSLWVKWSNGAKFTRGRVYTRGWSFHSLWQTKTRKTALGNSLRQVKFDRNEERTLETLGGNVGMRRCYTLSTRLKYQHWWTGKTMSTRSILSTNTYIYIYINIYIYISP